MEFKQWISGSTHAAPVAELGSGADRVVINVAFLSTAGVRLVKQLLAEAPVDLVVSLYLRVTRKAALEECLGLLKKPGKHPLRVCVLPETDPFHGKVVVFRKGANASVVIGSANWTEKGLAGDGEVSAVLHGTWKQAEGALLATKSWCRHGDYSVLEAVISSYKEASWANTWAKGQEEGLVLDGVWPATKAEEAIVESVVQKVEGVEGPDVRTFIVKDTKKQAPKYKAVCATGPGDLIVAINSSSRSAEGWPADDRSKAEVGEVLAVYPHVNANGTSHQVLLYRVLRDGLDRQTVKAEGEPDLKVDTGRVPRSAILPLLK